MYTFPQGLFTDVRIEDVSETLINLTLGELEEFRERSYTAAFIRVFDGTRWYYTSTTDPGAIQREIDTLAGYAQPDPNIEDHPTVQKLQANTGSFMEFDGQKRCDTVPKERKLELVQGYGRMVAGDKLVKNWRSGYTDRRVEKRILSSKGADLSFDFQRTGLRVLWELAEGEKHFAEMFDRSHTLVEGLDGQEEALRERFEESKTFLKESVPVEPGSYPVVLSPLAAGVFAHESFGHKSEADFMVGDQAMKEEWTIGKQVGTENLSIVDTGRIQGSGYVPFDDEGTRAGTTYLIKNGVLQGRLHSACTAADLAEEPTGNARAKDFEYEPIVRMTTTYIEAGEASFDELIAGIDRGIFIKTIQHGSGMTTFTIAPSLAYYIRDGRLAEPVEISVVTGNVFRTLNMIEGLSKEHELLSMAMGGCGKMEQFPLPVGFGGPYVRVKELNVR
jgi:TldD protein